MPEPTPKDLGALARDARIGAGMTQAQLGEKIGTSRFWVAEFERGKSRAELGLTLKALRALELVLTVEPKDQALRREHDERSTEQRLDRIPQPAVDLSSILSRSTIPSAWQTTAEPFRIHDWDTSSSSASAENTSPPESRKPRPTKKRKRGR
jgi:transcriptional regulator with XRE-family HTH domain